MRRFNEIDSAVESSQQAREILQGIAIKLRRLIRHAGAECTDELVDETARELLVVTLDPPRVPGLAPPWEPARYRLQSERSGITKRLALDGSDGPNVKLYCTLNTYDDGKPAELFISYQADSSTLGALLDALATAVSIGLQYGIPWEVFARKLVRTSFPPQGLTNEEDPELRIVSSILDYVFRWATKTIDSARRRAKVNESGSTEDTSTS